MLFRLLNSTHTEHMPLLLDKIQIQPSVPLSLPHFQTRPILGYRDPRFDTSPLMMSVTIKEDPLFEEEEASHQVKHSLLLYPMGLSMNNAFILYHINNSCCRGLIPIVPNGAAYEVLRVAQLATVQHLWPASTTLFPQPCSTQPP